MLSKLKTYLNMCIHPRLKYMPISLKLAFIYSIMLCLILIVTLSSTLIGIHYVLFHEAEVSINLSANYVEKKANNETVPELLQDVKSSALIPGVVMRVTDSNNNIVYDSLPMYISINHVQDSLARQEKHPQIEDYIRNALLPSDLKFVNFKHFWIFYTQRTIVKNNETYTLHFLRTITAEKVFLEELSETIFYAGIAGVIISIICGFLLSRRLLKPLRDITTTVKNIEIQDLNQRIKVQPTRDELEELSNTFNLMLERLQKGFEQQRQFVSDASHELRTPATVICGYSDMLARWGKDDPQTADECITAIHSEAINMQRLIEKLLFLARADQKRQVLHKESLNLKPLIADIAKDTQLIAPQHTITCTHNDDGYIFADELVMRQMLRIFLDNSIKYTPDGGKITISSENKVKHMIVKISDTGIGIAKDKQDKIFERFYRVDSARTRNGVGGTGLGLSIAKWIADAHDIEIRLSSKLNKGTTIILIIPKDN
jgi:signal transduction histidine kinase